MESENISDLSLGLSIKDVHSRGEGVVQCGQGVSSSDTDVRTFSAKNLDFSKFMVCPHGTDKRGLTNNQCGHFSDKGGGGLRF